MCILCSYVVKIRKLNSPIKLLLKLENLIFNEMIFYIFFLNKKKNGQQTQYSSGHINELFNSFFVSSKV